MNGPAIDCGKTPVEFTVLCLRLIVMALEKKKKRSQDLHFSFSFPVGTSIRVSMNCVFSVFSWTAVAC